MLIQILLLFTTHLILPIYFIYALWSGREQSRFVWLLKVTYSGAFLLYIFLAGRWDWLSYYLRYLLVLPFVVAIIVSYRRMQKVQFFVPTGSARWWNIGSGLLALLVFGSFLGWAIRGSFYTDTPVHLAFPLQDGWYYVGQGGNSTLLNYHNSSNSQRYAMDIVELNVAGARARGIYPTELERYAIFGETIHSPCSGLVVATMDGLPDQIPSTTDYDHPSGNHVVISCEGATVLLAHMQNGSVAVRPGDQVITAQPIGAVGNSGNTTEPHLHIHAVQAGSGKVLDGDGIPILFEDRFLMRNTTYTAGMKRG